MIIDSRDLEGLLDNLSNYYSEPFADSSQIPTLLVSKLAKNNVSVALSGDGGDELFAGYNRYLFTKKLWSIKSKIPNILNQTSAKILENINEKYFDFFLKKITSINNIGDKIHKGANLLKSDTIEELYLSLILHCKEPKKLLNSFSNDLNSDYLKKFNDVDTTKSSIEKLMYVDQITYLPDDILVKLDRASMAFSLETRVPLLNHKIVELSWQFPETLKIINGHTKWPLREILYKYVPKKFLEGPKKGFGIPLDQWIRSDLKDLINDVINTKTDLTENYLNKNYVNKILNEHHSKSKNWKYLIWNIFISQKWFIDNT
jgi:asparagine synthase (glutamine-hydrolysing)